LQIFDERGKNYQSGMDTKVNQVVEVVPSLDGITSELQKVMRNDDF
jgi:hypothetical protein